MEPRSSLVFTAAELSHPKYLKLVMFALSDWTRADAEHRLALPAFPDAEALAPQPRMAIDAVTGEETDLPDGDLAALSAGRVLLSDANPGKKCRDATARNALHLTRAQLCESLRETAAHMYGSRLAPSGSASAPARPTPPSHLIPGGAAAFAALFHALRAELDADESDFSDGSNEMVAALRGAEAADASSWTSPAARAVVTAACVALKEKGNGLFKARNALGALCAFADGLALAARFRLLAADDPGTVFDFVLSCCFLLSVTEYLTIKMIELFEAVVEVVTATDAPDGSSDAGSNDAVGEGLDEDVTSDALDEAEARLYFNRASVCMAMSKRTRDDLYVLLMMDVYVSTIHLFILLLCVCVCVWKSALVVHS